VIALAFAAMYWWLFIRPAPPGAAAQKPAPAMVASAQQTYVPAPAPAPIEPAPQPAPPVEAAPQKEPEPAKKAQAVKKTPEPAIPAAAFVSPAQGSTLKFVFKGQSWVEVRDSKGRLLFSRLNPPGSDAEVSGKPPFNVVVGNAPEVQLYYNDHEFDLEPHTRVAVARFTVE